MRPAPRLLLRVMTFLILTSCASGPRTPPEHDTAQNLPTKLSTYMEAAVRDEHFSGSVMVTKDGEPLLAQGYGLANIERQVLNTPQTTFRIGSITKSFTAMAIMILQEQAKLRVDDPLATHLPNLPKAWERITLHQLLTHTSGIIHSWDLPGFGRIMGRPATLEETIARYKGQPLVFSPSSGFHYSGVGYFILAAVIERVSGHTYATFLRQAIFEPLGMHSTGADQGTTVPTLNLPERAFGYIRSGTTVANAPYIYTPIFTGGGNLYSTVEDLSRWDQALAAGKLISAASYRRMYTPVRENYAYGWVVRRIFGLFGRLEISHEGGLPGFNAYILRFPEQKGCVVVLSNVAPMPVRQIAVGLAAIVWGER